MDQDSLRPAAFSCWCALLLKMDDEDVEVLIEPTFFIINYYWSLFDHPTRCRAKQLLLDLYKEFSGVLTAFIDKLPHLGHIPQLVPVERKLAALRKPQDQRSTFRTFAARLSHQNSGVAQQALTELITYLQDNQAYLQTSAVSGQPDTVVAKLIRALLDCAAKHSSSQPEIASLCTQCLGLVGCLDSNRIETTRTEKSMVVLTNFADADETTNFVLFILEEVLVKAFLSTTDTKLQGYLSFAMQELMTKVDIHAAVALDRTKNPTADRVYTQWIKLPEDVREVLRPFLGSSYMLAPGKLTLAKYPIFQPGRTYHNWMRAFSLDLLQKGQNDNAQIVFDPLTRAIRVKDLYVAEFLLPYLVLHVVVGDASAKEQREEVVSELVNILKYEPPEAATYHEREHMKLYYEVSAPGFYGRDTTDIGW
jgi:serine/threonine-protein kinase ATR